MMTRSVGSDAATRWLAGAAILAGAVCCLAGARALFLPAPPMLDRLGRAVALLLVPGLLTAAPAALAFFIWHLPARWDPGWRWLAGIAAAAAATAACAFASTLAFVALHLACHFARLCALTSVPERALRAVNAATSDPMPAALIVVPAMAAFAFWMRHRVDRADA